MLNKIANFEFSVTFLTMLMMSVITFSLGFYVGFDLLTMGLLLGVLGIVVVGVIVAQFRGSGVDFNPVQVLSLMALVAVAIIFGYGVSYGGMSIMGMI